jgi:hypothetical protein
MERPTWTDERLDDAIARIEQRFDTVDRRFDAVDRRFEAMERRMEDGFTGVRTELAALRGELVATNRLVAQIGWGVAGVFLAQTIALIVGVIAFS